MCSISSVFTYARFCYNYGSSSSIIYFVGLFAGIFKKILGEKGRKNREVNVQVTKWILQSFSGIKEIKVINAEDFLLTIIINIIVNLLHFKDNNLC